MVTPEEKRALLDEFRPDDAADSSYSYFDEMVDDDRRADIDCAVGVQVGNEFISWGEFWALEESRPVNFSERALQRIDAALRRVGA